MEYTRPGSVYKIFKWHQRQGLNESGEKPVIIKKEPETKKNKKLN
tara:strand:- start:558 stop:692 length:135 start_codon:yes stop_codon:yes gene_type:complete